MGNLSTAIAGTSFSASTVYTFSLLLSRTPNAFLLLLSIRIYKLKIGYKFCHFLECTVAAAFRDLWL